MTAELNPYQSPASNVVTPEDTSKFEPAGNGRRLGTFIVDYLCFLLCLVLLWVGLALVFGEEGIDTLSGIPDRLLALFGYFFYYLFFESVWARTPAKLIFRTYVVDEAGRKPPFGQIVKRTLCRFIPFEPLSFLWGDLGWHDSISKTRVVCRRKL